MAQGLDFIAQGWEGGPLPLTSGPVVQQLPFPVAQCRRVLEVLGLDGGLLVAADPGDLLVDLIQVRPRAGTLLNDRQAPLDSVDAAEKPRPLHRTYAPRLVLALESMHPLYHLLAHLVQVRA